MPTDDAAPLEYAGFWSRVLASLIDTVLICIVVLPILLTVYGPGYFELDALIAGRLDFLLNWVLPAIVVILFWVYKEATPGKMALGMRVVDATTGGRASTAQYVGRYFGYFVSILPLCLGLLWIGWDARKQGWHDKLAGTVVVRRRASPEVPTFRPAA